MKSRQKIINVNDEQHPLQRNRTGPQVDTSTDILMIPWKKSRPNGRARSFLRRFTHRPPRTTDLSGPRPRETRRVDCQGAALARGEIPRQSDPLPLRQSAPLISLQNLAPGTEFLRPETKWLNRLFFLPRPAGAYHTSHDARTCGPFSRSLREREVTRVRGGPAWTRTRNQTVMSGRL